MRKAVFSVVITIVQIITTFAAYELWIPRSVNRTDLRCPNSCNTGDYKSHEHCCTCHAVPSWQLDNQIRMLRVEYTRRDGKAVIVDDGKVQSRLIHHYGFLSRFPINMCSFNIVEIDLQHNFIDDIGNIACLSSLDTLDLSFNSISSVGKKIISNLPLLRELNLNHNKIKALEPYALAGTTIALFRADLSFNNLTELDISNIIPEHMFCDYDYTHNKIEEITNMEDFELDVNKVYEGGFVDLASNLLTQFVVWEDIGIKDIRELGKVMEFGFSLQNMKWECDCRMESYLELSEDIINRLWRDFFNVTCWNPPQYRGLSIPNYFLKGNRLDLLICNISNTDKCPRDCYCYEQPKNKRTVVNCTGAGLNALPDYVPDGENLTLILKDNDIKVLEKKEYFNRSYSIDLSNNSLQEIPNDAFQNMKYNVLLDLSENKINELPRSFQTFDPCKTPIGKLAMPCDCRHSWLTDWVKNKNGKECSNTTEIFCVIEGKTTSVADINWNRFCQDEENFDFLNILFGVLFALILGFAILAYIFRYEIFILTRKLKKRNYTKIYPNIKHDVFISFSEEDDKIRRWVIQFLDSSLQLSGYRTFIPCRDEAAAVNREEALINRIQCSKNYIVILCHHYSTEDAHWTTIEWKHIWNNYRESKEKQIIILNYDQMDSFNLGDKKIKAFLRLGTDVDFSNRNHQLVQDIKKRLGDPLHMKYRITNENTHFITKTLYKNDIFTVEI